jgi:hypothetical protein
MVLKTARKDATNSARTYFVTAGMWDRRALSHLWPRLRCFLSGTLGVFVMCLVACGSLNAQLEAPKPIRITHVEGLVVNSNGKPVVNAEITLVRDEKTVYSTRTNADGAFQIEHARGNYIFRVGRTEYAPAAQELYVTDEIVTHLEHKKLYVVVGPGVCMDACSSVFTSKREFEKAIAKNSRH